MSLACGILLGPYEVVALLGAGGMGEVYKARDHRLKRDVALKVLSADVTADPERLARFHREAELLAALNHPHIVQIHGIVEAHDSPALVMELVEGATLAERLSRGAVPVSEAVAVAIELADALDYAHEHGVIHRDLKPANIKFTVDGAIKVLDFGIAKAVAPEGRGLAAGVQVATRTSPVMSKTHVVLGTVGYMAPEQARGLEVDERADIWALGAILYELLVGVRAFAGDTAADVITAVLRSEPAELPRTVPAGVRDIVRRCLEKRREERFESAGDVSIALRQAMAAIAADVPDVRARPLEAPSPQAIREHLAKLLSTPSIAGAERLSALLRFVVQETLDGRQGLLKEARIGLDVFGRKPDSYDPAIDPIVRVQMGRLRSKLRAYYGGPGVADRLRIDIPLGSYVPTFTTFAGQSHVPPSPVAQPPVDLRIAVLPIVNMSPDPENQYFCDGLTEELITHLAQIPQLRVVARTSSFQFKDAARDIREVGRLLDVAKVLEGSVRKAGNRIRVTVQLINVPDGCHLWSERYEGDLTDIFAIHEQIATAVQRSLELQMLGTAKSAGRARPRMIDAYNHYLQGRYQWKKRTEEGLRAAIEHFEEACRLDPSFARALSGVADCHLMLGMSAAEAPDRSMPYAADAARQALDLDEGLAEAHASLAAVKNCFEWDFSAAEQGYRHASRLDPSYATALHWLGLFLNATQGRLTAAVEALEQAIELDPLSAPIISDLAIVHGFREDFDAAAMYCRRALSLDAHFHRPHWFMGLAQGWSGQFEAAEQSLQKGLELCPGAAFRSRLLGALGYVYGRWGKRKLAEDVKERLARMRETCYVPSFELAQIEIGLDNHAGALACLEDAVTRRDSYAIFLKTWNAFRPLANEPRFRALVAQIGLE